MNVAFFHDSKFIVKDSKYYTSGTLNNELFKFYLNFFENITVVTRKIEYNSSKSKYINANNLVKNEHIKFNCVYNFSNCFEIIKNEVINNDFIIIRCHSFIGTIAAYYSRKYKKKYLVESVSCAWDCLWNHSFKGKLTAPIMFLLTKKVIRNAYAVTYVSEKFLQKRYPNSNYLLSCSDVYIEDNNLKNERKYYSKNKKIKIANIANLDMKYKGQKYLIYAVHKLITNGYNIELNLIGGGSGRKLKRLVDKLNIQSYINFLGVVEHKKIFELLKKTDIYVQPSNAESHGRVIVEAMSVACPVIGSNVGGIPELVHPKFVFKKSCINDLTNKIQYLIDNPTELEKLSKYSYDKSKEYRKQILYNKKYDFYKKIMEVIND